MRNTKCMVVAIGSIAVCLNSLFEKTHAQPSSPGEIAPPSRVLSMNSSPASRQIQQMEEVRDWRVQLPGGESVVRGRIEQDPLMKGAFRILREDGTRVNASRMHPEDKKIAEDYFRKITEKSANQEKLIPLAMRLGGTPGLMERQVQHLNGVKCRALLTLDDQILLRDSQSRIIVSPRSVFGEEDLKWAEQEIEKVSLWKLRTSRLVPPITEERQWKGTGGDQGVPSSFAAKLLHGGKYGAFFLVPNGHVYRIDAQRADPDEYRTIMKISEEAKVSDSLSSFPDDEIHRSMRASGKIQSWKLPGVSKRFEAVVAGEPVSSPQGWLLYPFQLPWGLVLLPEHVLGDENVAIFKENVTKGSNQVATNGERSAVSIGNVTKPKRVAEYFGKEIDLNQVVAEGVSENEVIERLPTIETTLASRLPDMWAQNREEWQDLSVGLKQKAAIVSVSPNGDYVIVQTDRSHELVHVTSGKHKPLTISDPIEFLWGSNSDVLWIITGSKSFTWSYGTNEEVKEVPELQGPFVGIVVSSNQQAAWLLNQSRKLVRLALDSTKHVATYDFSSIPNADEMASRTRLSTTIDGKSLFWREGKTLIRFDSVDATSIREHSRTQTPPELQESSLLLGEREQLWIAPNSELGEWSPNLDLPKSVDDLQQMATGGKREWMGFVLIDGQLVLQKVIEESLRGSEKEKSFLVIYTPVKSQSAAQGWLIQRIRCAQSETIHFLPNGTMAWTQSNGLPSRLLRRPPLVTPQLNEKHELVNALVVSNDVAMLEAIGKQLRRQEFDHLIDDYPDHVFDDYITTILSTVMKYGWKENESLEMTERLLERWTQLCPSGIVSRTALAKILVHRGWQSRGSGFADTVTEEGRADFERKIKQARNVLQPMMLEETDPPGAAFEATFQVAMAQGWEPDAMKVWMKKLLEGRASRCIDAHRIASVMQLPRWHGKPRDSETYVTQVSDNLDPLSGDILYARLMLNLVKYYPADEPVSNYLKLDLDRLARGAIGILRELGDVGPLQRVGQIAEKEDRRDLLKTFQTAFASAATSDVTFLQRKDTVGPPIQLRPESTLIPGLSSLLPQARIDAQGKKIGRFEVVGRGAAGLNASPNSPAIIIERVPGGVGPAERFNPNR